MQVILSIYSYTIDITSFFIKPVKKPSKIQSI